MWRSKYSMFASSSRCVGLEQVGEHTDRRHLDAAAAVRLDDLPGAVVRQARDIGPAVVDPAPGVGLGKAKLGPPETVARQQVRGLGVGELRKAPGYYSDVHACLRNPSVPRVGPARLKKNAGPEHDRARRRTGPPAARRPAAAAPSGAAATPASSTGGREPAVRRDRRRSEPAVLPPARCKAPRRLRRGPGRRRPCASSPLPCRGRTRGRRP